MSDDRLFPLDGIPEVPLFREPPPGRCALIMDERISHDYPPEWSKCPTCGGRGRAEAELPDPLPAGGVRLDIDARYRPRCPDCLGMGSVKAMVRLLADHRCERCHHPYVPKGDAKMLGVEPSAEDGGRWSPCDYRCDHSGPYQIMQLRQRERPLYWSDVPGVNALDIPVSNWLQSDHDSPEVMASYWAVRAAWRILTVHHLDGDKANLAWWNLAALCQRCHLEIQAKVVLERVYPHEHSEWFKPHAAGWYAHAYLGEDLTRTEVAARMDELLALESVPA